MKVSRVDKIMEIYNTSKMKKTEKAKKTEGKDTVALSNQGKDYQKLLKPYPKYQILEKKKLKK